MRFMSSGKLKRQVGFPALVESQGGKKGSPAEVGGDSSISWASLPHKYMKKMEQKGRGP